MGTTPERFENDVVGCFLASAAEALEPGQRRRLQALWVAPRNAADERRRACALLTRTRDWAATALADAGASVPTLPQGPMRTGDDAFHLLRALEPVADELDAAAADAALRRLVDAAVVAARVGTGLGPLPAGGLGSVRAPGLGARIVEEVAPAEDELLEVGARAGQVLSGWTAAGLGDPLAAAEEAVQAAAAPA